jgi:acetolactate synthase-1/2/3 large subunit
MRTITVSDYLVEELIANGITDVFGYQGGMIAYFFDSLAKYKSSISYHIPYNEQGGAFSACGYSQKSGQLGCAFCTSGPGFTNMLTGMANAFFDSIPVLFIAGQVNFKDKLHGLPMRQKGFQEIKTAEVSRPICKKSFDIETADQIVPSLREAISLAMSGRKGPVFLDIPIKFLFAHEGRI